MVKKLKLKLIGVAPLITHNNQGVDPLNEYAKAIKQISGKKQKTEADLYELGRLEFESGLYINEKDQVILPSKIFEGMLINGAKKFKEGPAAKAGAFVEEDSLLEFKDMKTKGQNLFEKKEYVFRAPVKVQQSTIIRTRPIFNKWSTTFEVQFFPDVCQKEQIIKWIERAGEVVGAGDYRPRYGRFTVQVLK